MHSIQEKDVSTGEPDVANFLKMSELKDICRKDGLHLSRMRGQNFLIDGNILSHLADITLADSGNSVIEIGAGPGNWTDYLAERAPKVYALEVDRRLYSILKQRMEFHPHVEPIHADVLKFDFDEFFRCHRGEQFVIAGNLPYHVISPILFLWCRLYRETAGAAFERACFMVQREVAERMTAQPGRPEYGRLSVMLAYESRVRLEHFVSRQCFFPRPRVDSAFVSLAFGAGLRQGPPEEDAFLEEVVRLAFGQRRKQLRNALASFRAALKPGGVSWEEVFERAGVDGSLRAGAVSPEAFVRLARSLRLLSRPADSLQAAPRTVEKQRR